MYNQFYKNLSENSKNLIDYGYKIFDIEDVNLLRDIEEDFKSFLKVKNNLDVNDLSDLHNHLDVSEVNQVRINYFQKINNDLSFSKQYLKMGEKIINEVVGTELAANKSVNFSIQMPHDETSLLGIHSDTFSGESEFQINLWIPITNSFQTNSMFIFNPEFSKETIDHIEKYEEVGIKSMLENEKDQYQFLELNYGQGLIFTPTCLHGNTLNSTSKTRISFNCRYKNLFSPYCAREESEKKLGSFYKPITPKAATLIGLKNKISY